MGNSIERGTAAEAANPRKIIFEKALLYQDASKGKGPCTAAEPTDPWICALHGCNTEVDGGYALIEQYRTSHNMEPHQCSALKYAFAECAAIERIQRRQASGNMPSGRRWPWPWEMPKMKADEKIIFSLIT